MGIINRMLDVMDKKDIKTKQVLEYLNINKSTFSTWKSRNTNPPIEFTERICELLDITYEYYLTGKTNGIELTNEEKLLIDNYRKCTNDRKQSILNNANDLALVSELQNNNETSATQEGNSSPSKVG